MYETSPLRDRILHFGRKLPSTPAVLGKLQHLLGNVNSGLEEICALLKRDAALSARIIRISNSPFFSPGIPHTSLEEAVGCVGYDQICKVVGPAIASQLFDRNLGHYAIQADRLWENTLGCALAMESLAQFVGTDPRTAYTTGLMRSLGKVVLDRVAVERSLASYNPECSEPLASWEKDVFGCDNPAASALLLGEWKFSGEAIDAVRRHYEPMAASCEATGSALLLNLAGHIARDLGYGLPGETSYWDSLPEKLSHAGLSETEFDLCREEVRMAFEQVRQLFADPAPI